MFLMNGIIWFFFQGRGGGGWFCAVRSKFAKEGRAIQEKATILHWATYFTIADLHKTCHHIFRRSRITIESNFGANFRSHCPVDILKIDKGTHGSLFHWAFYIHAVVRTVTWISAVQIPFGYHLFDNNKRMFDGVVNMSIGGTFYGCYFSLVN